MDQWQVDDVVRVIENALAEMDPETRGRFVEENPVEEILTLLKEGVKEAATETEEADDGAEEEGTDAEVVEASDTTDEA